MSGLPRRRSTELPAMIGAPAEHFSDGRKGAGVLSARHECGGVFESGQLVRRARGLGVEARVDFAFDVAPPAPDSPRLGQRTAMVLADGDAAHAEELDAHRQPPRLIGAISDLALDVAAPA